VRPLVFPSFSRDRAAPPRAAVPGRASADAAALAAREIEAIRERARAEAFEAGLREGRAAALREWSGRLDRAVRSVEDAARSLLAARVELAAQVDRELPKLLLTLAGKVLHQELSVSQTAAQTVIRGLTERLAGWDRPVVVRLAPDMAETFEAWRGSDDGARAAGPGVRIEADGQLGPGEWVLDTGDGFLDGRVASQLEEAWRLVTELPR
jgi:flagellar biosynthesis/type III secretory pathway protein FliH